MFFVHDFGDRGKNHDELLIEYGDNMIFPLFPKSSIQKCKGGKIYEDTISKQNNRSRKRN